MTIEKAIGQVIREQRNKKGISQENLAFASGLHRTYISLIERGLRNPSVGTLFDLAEPLGITPSAIIRLVENRINR